MVAARHGATDRTGAIQSLFTFAAQHLVWRQNEPVRSHIRSGAMPSDVAISAIAANSTDRDVIETPRPAVATTQAATASSPGSPSPTLRLDPALGLVVIEFLGKTGAVTSSIPTQQQLQAYRAGTEPVPGQHVHQAATATSRDI